MDPRYLIGALLTRKEIEAGRPRPSPQAGEDAYYLGHTPVDRRVPRFASFVAAVCFGAVAIGFWHQ